MREFLRSVQFVAWVARLVLVAAIFTGHAALGSAIVGAFHPAPSQVILLCLAAALVTRIRHAFGKPPDRAETPARPQRRR